jgi:hypothetical protein
MAKKRIIKKVKLSEIKSRMVRWHNKDKVKNLTASIQGGGYSPEKYNKRIVLMTWGKSIAPSYVNTIKDKEYSIWDGHHRVKALKSLYPPDHEIEVEIKQVHYGVKLLTSLLMLGIVFGVLWIFFTNIWILLVVVVWGILRETKHHLNKKKQF